MRDILQVKLTYKSDDVCVVFHSLDLVAEPRQRQGLGRGKSPSCRLKADMSPISNG